MYESACDSTCKNRRFRMYFVYLVILLTCLLFALTHFLVFLKVRRKTRGEARDTAKVKTIIIEDSESILEEEYYEHQHSNGTAQEHISEYTEITMEQLSVAALAIKTKTVPFEEMKVEKIMKNRKIPVLPVPGTKLDEKILKISVADVLPINSSANGQTPQIKIENGCEPGGMTPDLEKLGRKWESIPEISEISDSPVSDTDSLSSRIYSLTQENDLRPKLRPRELQPTSRFH